MKKSPLWFRGIALTLCLCIGMVACSPEQVAAFDRYVGVAVQMVSIVANILAAVGVNVPAQALNKVNADGAALKKLGDDFAAAEASAKPGVQSQINAQLALLAQDASAIFTLAQVSNVNSQAKINVLIGLATSAIQLAESLFPNPQTAKVYAAARSGDQIVASFNATLKAKSGDAALDAACSGKSVHVHSKVVRVLTLGLAQ